MNDARRQVERALASEEAADDLAAAVDRVLTDHGELSGPEHQALRAALAKYRKTRPAP